MGKPIEKWWFNYNIVVLEFMGFHGLFLGFIWIYHPVMTVTVCYGKLPSRNSVDFPSYKMVDLSHQ